MARGGLGAFGGVDINTPPYWLTFCAVFLFGLLDWRRLLSVRNLDLVVLLSFTLSLWFFNHGNVFAAMPVVYPAFAWLIARCLWIARHNRASKGSVVWPTWVLVVLTLCLIGWRIDLNVYHSNVIDVGLSGVIGAERIANFQDPYGNFPIEGNRPDCGPADASGEVRDRIQTNGRCEAADPLGDTYGPVAYEAYLPAYFIFGWSGKWDTLPTAHATSILWDLVCIAGLFFVGLRFGGPRLGVILAFAWAAWPFTQYSSNSNTNDMIQPALLVWGFYFVAAPFKRGAFAALSAWTKFAPLLLVPLWSGFPDTTSRRPRLRFLWGFAAATIVAFLILFFDPSPWHAIKIFVHHTFGYQLGRSSPFSIWDWRQYHARGLPDLHRVQQVLEGALVAGAVVLGRWPRKRSPLRLAAFTGALLVGFEAILTHWSYLYLEWFFPFVAFAFFAPASAEGTLVASSEDWSKPLRRLRDTVPARRREIVGLVLAVVVFLGSWEALSHGFYAHPQIIDTPIYQNYGSEMTAGKVPYRDFAVEYPPGALPVFVAPTIDTASYRTIFSWMMALCGVGCIILVWLRRPSAFALPFLAISPLLLGSLGPNHFDLWPTLFLTAALTAFVRDRHRLGWAALGAAFAIKLFPAVVIPMAIIWTLRRRGRRELARSVAIGAAVVAAAFGPFAVLAPHGLWESLWGQFSRPLQIETLAGSFFETFGHPVITYSHGSLNLAGYGWLGAIFVVALLGVLVALWTSFARRPVDPDRFVRYSAACVCAFIVFGKVLSPQFVIWLVPLVPLVRGRRGLAATALLGVALVDMLVWFPNRYYSYVTSGHLAWLVFARDLLLLATLAVLAIPQSRFLSKIAVLLGLEPNRSPLADKHAAEHWQQPQALPENPL